MADPPVLGLLADFASPEKLVEAARAARDEGIPGLDAFTPFPVDALDPLLGASGRALPRLAFAGGLFGLVAAYAMQIATNLDFPLDIGGRPLIAWQGFALIAFELSVLFAVGFMGAGFFILNRLPRYHQPLFEVARFERATDDGFFLYVPVAAGTLARRRALLRRLGARSIDEVAA